MTKMNERDATLETALDGFEAQARRSGVPEPLVAYARTATARKFGSLKPPAAGLTPARIRAYAAGVVRRRSVRSSASRDLAARYTLWSLAADLRASGRGGAEICEKIGREWGDSLSEDLLCELREKLCA